MSAVNTTLLCKNVDVRIRMFCNKVAGTFSFKLDSKLPTLVFLQHFSLVMCQFSLCSAAELRG